MQLKECLLGDVVTFQRGHDLPKARMVNGPYPVLGSNGIIGYHNKYTTTGPVIVVGRSGNVGRPFMVKSDAWAHNTSLYIKDFKGNDPIFIYYFLQTLNLERFAGGSAVPTLNRNHISTIDVKLPADISTQRKIGATLASFDAKISINNKINDNLQKQTLAIFNKCFIKTAQGCNTRETELGLFPDSFSITKTENLPIVVTDYVANGSFSSLKENVNIFNERNFAYFIRNTDLKSGIFEMFVDEHSYNFLEKSRLFGGEIIISNVGDVGSVFLCPKLDAPMTLGNNIIMLKTENDAMRYFLYIWFKWSIGQQLIQGIRGGSAQPKFNKTDFKALPVILPPETLLNKFYVTVHPMFEAISKHQTENKILSALRDALIKKLVPNK